MSFKIGIIFNGLLFTPQHEKIYVHINLYNMNFIILCQLCFSIDSHVNLPDSISVTFILEIYYAFFLCIFLGFSLNRKHKSAKAMIAD